MGANQAQSFKGFKWTVGNEDVPALALLVDNTSEQLHIAKANDFNTDWALAVCGDPTVCIHCAGTNAATDFIKLYHDDTDAHIDAVGATALNLLIAGTSYLELTATELSLDGELLVADGHGLQVGHATQLVISTGDGATNLIPEVQMLGSAAADSTMLIGTFNATNTIAPMLAFIKSGSAAVGSATTIVADNEYVGRIIAFGCDGVDLEAPVAEIRFVVNGTPGTGDMPGSIEFFTTADAGETLTVALTLEQDQEAFFADDVNMVSGKQLQTASGNDQTFAIAVGSVSTNAVAGVQKVIEVSSATEIAKAELGFYGTTPTAQHATNVVAVTAASFDTNAVAAVNACLSCLQAVGLMAST